MGLADVRANLKTALGNTTAGALVLDANRIDLGYKIVDKKFFDDVNKNGPYALIRAGSLREFSRVDSVQKPLYEIRMTLWIGFERNADEDITAAEGLVDAIFDKLVDASNFLMLGPPPQGVSWDEPNINAEIYPGIIEYNFILEFMTC